MSLPVPQPPRDNRVVRDDSVHRITSAQTPLSQEQHARTRRYLISMAIRTVCFLGAIAASGWLRWALLVGAVVLPYVAVIMANAGRENDEFTQESVPIDLTQVDNPARPQIGRDPQ